MKWTRQMGRVNFLLAICLLASILWILSKHHKHYYSDTTVDDLINELGINHSTWMDQCVSVHQFPGTDTFVHNPVEACKDEHLEHLIAVTVSRSNFGQRQTVRETWGSYAKDPMHKAALLFFVGSSQEKESSDVQRKIDEEAARYADIVQGQFTDTYRNLSLKSLSVLKWVDTFCPRVDFLTKADDDVYVVMPTLVNQLRRTRTKLAHWRFVFGYVMSHARPIRKKRSKWYASPEEYPGDWYPPYTSGMSYSTTGKAARRILQAALRTPFLWLEDVYITGLSSLKAGVSLVNNSLQNVRKDNPNGCLFRTKSIGHRLSMKEIRNIHRKLYDKSLKCSNRIPADNTMHAHHHSTAVSPSVN